MQKREKTNHRTAAWRGIPSAATVLAAAMFAAALAGLASGCARGGVQEGSAADGSAAVVRDASLGSAEGSAVEGAGAPADGDVEQDTPDADAVAKAKARLRLTETYYEDLQHGDKGAAYQKYIVLHDTEGSGSAEGVLSYWEGNGNLVAAHFIVNKDGSILQCVPMDRIAHHAGWGSGNANERFGITEDGRDDLRGRAPSSVYTDYGMNAWSIGIEMVHVGGETYPEEQLEAVDDLIAYIDAYYGGDGGTIIDHKMWRAGNSDTNPEFAVYLANYQDHRTHD